MLVVSVMSAMFLMSDITAMSAVSLWYALQTLYSVLDKGLCR